MSVYNQGGPSATSLNFIGFDDFAKNTINPLVYDRIVIQLQPPFTSGRNIHAAAGFVPGDQPHIKTNQQIKTESNAFRNMMKRFNLLNLREA